jgi:hypothetical protein
MALNFIFSWLIKKRIPKLEYLHKFPFEVQKETLKKLIRTSKNTIWGRENNFSKIKEYEHFCKLVPLQEYEDIKPWVDRLIKGEQNLLWPTETKWFAKSSGTTSERSKLIPVTKEALKDCHQKGGKDLLAIYYKNYPKGDLYSGKHLVIGGSAELNKLSNESFFGDLSAIIMKTLPWWAEVKRTPSKQIALMNEWEEKIEKIAINTIQEDVHVLVGVPSWTLVLANKILEISGKNNLKEVWPNLELYMHGGVSFDPYREQFTKLIPDSSMRYIESYNASEGFFAMQDRVESNDLLLMLDYGIFYEFIPMSDFLGVKSKIIYNLSEVKLGENYAIVISTNAGLWRYIIGDTVRFTSLEPFRIVVTGRTRSFINAFGEEVIVDNAEKAIAEASLITKSQVRDYTACPVYMDGRLRGRHEWLIEFICPPEDIELFVNILHSSLRKINSDYDAKRTKNMVLDLLKITVLENGVFDRWLKSKGKLGGQNKVPRLSNDREYLEQILNFSQELTCEYKNK